MDRAVAICACGRSGSILLASYLDGHDDVIMIPNDRSTRIYEFFEHYRSLSLHDKLISYPILVEFFQEDSPISAPEYYAAVQAIFEVYRTWPTEFLETRGTFVKFLNVAYSVALGRRPASPSPLIVHAQHYWNDELARLFVEDFPQARFIHTVRDPLTNCSRLFDHWHNPASVIQHLVNSDTAHTDMASRTRAIRFEDLHLHLKKTMHAVAEWLGLPYRSSLLDSTLNGVPWVVKRGTNSWSGPRPDQATRDLRNISFTDRGLLFAVFSEDFVAWNYPFPKVFEHASVRVLTLMFVLFIPMKMEIIAAWTTFKALPSQRGGRLLYAIRGLRQIFICRATIMSMLAAELFRRLTFGKQVLKLL
jgi:hypothetical protein